MMKSPLLDIENISVAYDINGSTIPVVDRASFYLGKGEILAIVGESGCGKSQLALALANLSPKQAIVEKQINAKSHLKIAMVFQEPLSALNPVITIGEQIRESLNSSSNTKNDRSRVIDLLESVGIQNAKTKLHHYPHQFSGGMRQRVLIAIAMAMEPDVLIADEPTTALDVTIQRQILDLLKAINARKKLSILFITHDLTLLPSLADRIMVMYAGKIVESGKTDVVLQRANHPYTKKLLSAARLEKSNDGKYESIPGIVPSPEDYPKGCPFADRCDLALPDCSTVQPQWNISGEHGWACPVAD